MTSKAARRKVKGSIPRQKFFFFLFLFWFSLDLLQTLWTHSTHQTLHISTQRSESALLGGEDVTVLSVTILITSFTFIRYLFVRYSFPIHSCCILLLFRVRCRRFRVRHIPFRLSHIPFRHWLVHSICSHSHHLWWPALFEYSFVLCLKSYTRIYSNHNLVFVNTSELLIRALWQWFRSLTFLLRSTQFVTS